MNLKALITTLAILGSSSVAMARPATVSASAEASWSLGTKPSSGPTVRDHRYPPPVTTPAPIVVRHDQSPAFRGWFRWYRPGYQWHQPRPLLLANKLTFSNGETRKFIAVGAVKGRFSKLRIAADGGRTFLKQVYVEFTDGNSQVIRNIDRVLRRNEVFTIDLDGNRRAIKRIVVYGRDTFTRGQRARRANGAFDVIAL